MPRDRQGANAVPQVRRTVADAKVHVEPTSVRHGRRAYDPNLLGAGLGEREHPIQWLDNRRLRLLLSDKRESPGIQSRALQHARQLSESTRQAA